jgi:hypothetical protein
MTSYEFPPVIVVTLAEEPWKRPVAENHLLDHGIEAQYLEGIHGMSIGLRTTNPYDFDTKTGHPQYMHMSQMGCALTHRMALAAGLAQGFTEFLIMEDDVILEDDFKEKFIAFRDALPDDAEVAQLQYIHADDKPKIKINSLVGKIAYPFCSSCIWWSAQGAMKAVALLHPIDRPYDLLLSLRVYPFLGYYTPNTPLACQRTIRNQWPSSVGDAPKIVI